MTAHALLAYLEQLTVPQVEELLGRDHVVRRARQYAEEGRVEQIWIDGKALRAHVGGSSSTPYHCVLRLHGGAFEPECSCPYSRGICWHVGAVMLTSAGDRDLAAQLASQAARVSSPELQPSGEVDPAAPPALESNALGAEAATPEASELWMERLLAFPKSELAEALARQLSHDSRLRGEWIERLSELESLDVRLFRQAARVALRSGQRLSRWEVPRVAADLDEIAASVVRASRSAKPEAGLDLLLEIAWSTWRRAEEQGDQEAALRESARRTLGWWLRGQEEFGGRDRQKIARELFGWVLEDGAGCLSGLLLEAKTALGPIGWETLAGLLQPLIDRRLSAQRGTTEAGAPVAIDPLVARARSALREVAELKGELDLFLSESDPDGMQGPELVAVTERLERQGRLTDALLWAERGRSHARGSARAKLDLQRLRLLQQLGRRREAREAAWALFLAEPGAASFSRLVDLVDDAERGEWKRRALEYAERAFDPRAFVEVALAGGDVERVAHRLQLDPELSAELPTEILAPLALALEHAHLKTAATVMAESARRRLRAGHNREAKEDLDRAREWLIAGSASAEWDELLSRIRERFDVVRDWY